MKILYCHCSLYNPGGMERVLLNKVRWLVKAGHEILVVTTDQQNRPLFYEFPSGVRLFDLNINYSLDNNKPIYQRIPSYLRKRRMHRQRLTELLMRERPDITISLYPSESSFIPDIKDGSKKILELHFNRFFRLQYGRKGMTGLIDRYRSRMDKKIARSFDRFVVLTEEDRRYWGWTDGISVIPNAAQVMTMKSSCEAKRVIAVGRLDYQKSFDRLIQTWELVKKSKISEGWNLDIFGQGEWQKMLEEMISDKGLENTVKINAPTNRIEEEYANSSIIAMTSHYEGFGMVLVEAMSCGVPAIAFDCKCGPRDIITHHTNGLIVPDGDVRAFADALLRLMADDNLRRQMGRAATTVIDRYSEERVMRQWTDLFEKITR